MNWETELTLVAHIAARLLIADNSTINSAILARHESMLPATKANLAHCVKLAQEIVKETIRQHPANGLENAAWGELE